MTPREKALGYLLQHCRHGQRTKDLHEKLAFVELEIELTELLKRSGEFGSPGESVPFAANFSRREDDPGTNGHEPGAGGAQ